MKKIILSICAIFLFMGMSYVAQAVSNPKPTVLYIYGKYCGACTRFEPTFDSARSKYSQKFNFKAEEYDTSSKARELHVTGTPSVYILDNGKVQKIEWSCLSSPGCFEKRLQNY